MPPLFPSGSLECPCMQRWSWLGHKLLSVETWQCRGAWRMASLESYSCICCGSAKDTITSLASLLASSFPGTANSSSHQSGVSHLSDFHGTHWLKSVISGSRGVFLPSSSEVSGDPHRKEATVGFKTGSSSKSEPLPWDPSLPHGILRLADWLGAGLSANLTWWHLLFCPSPPWSTVVPALRPCPRLGSGSSAVEPLDFPF